MTGLDLFSRYLPVEPTLLDWGMYVLDAGYFDVPAGSEYPVGKHPEEYLFSWEKGRVLEEFQMVYLSRGQGVFECEDKKPVKVKAGDMMLLRPGMWHRYKPDSETGWAESWVGFQGEYAQRLMEKFFPANDDETDFFFEHRAKFLSDNDFLLIALENEEGVFQKEFLKNVDAYSERLSKIKDVNYVSSITNQKEHFIFSRTESMPYESNCFNHIICNAVLHFAEDLSHFLKMFEELLRILKPGGSLFIRTASNFGLENQGILISNGIYELTDGSTRFLLTQEILNILLKYNICLLENIKTCANFNLYPNSEAFLSIAFLYCSSAFTNCLFNK